MNLGELPGWLLLAAYASVVVEMTCFAVPSEASTYQIFQGDRDAPEGLALARQRSRATKWLVYFAPTALGIVGFLGPLLVLAWPAARPWTWPVAATTPAMTWVGLALIFLGRTITTCGALRLRRNDRLQRGGVFAFTRNPILVGMYLFYLGNCVWLPAPIVWAIFVPYAWNMHRRVRLEEEFLGARLGEPYARYLNAVPRYLGLPKPR